MNAIIYGSQYGTAKQYATELARITGFQLFHYEDAFDINRFDTIVYIGALYAGGVLGMKKTFKKLSTPKGKRIIIATVGLADPTDAENIRNIRTAMKNQLSSALYEQAEFFHLRGGIDYSQLSFAHKTMMALLYRKAVGLPEEKKTAEVKAMIETYNKKVNFVDLNRLQEILNVL